MRTPLSVVRRLAIPLALLLPVLAVGDPARAEPATPGSYPINASATLTTGRAFDTCTAPPISTLRAWKAADYHRVNIYFGGVNRGCAQPNLTGGWVAQATALGYLLIPTYFGRQPSCIFGTKPYRYTASTAAAYGASEANDAIAKSRALGIIPGSALYADVEHYDRTNASCVLAARRYVSAWTKTLHAGGFLAGVYVHQDSGLLNLSGVYTSTTYARPDAVWMARWDGNPSLVDWPTAPNSRWSFHQRAKQYRGDHDETWGGVTLNIDSDQFDAPVATVARPYTVTSASPLNGRSEPFTNAPVRRSYAPGSTIKVVCQGYGQRVGTSNVWNRVADGSWVSDSYVSTPSQTTFSPPLQRCIYPGQVTSGAALTARTGPSASHPPSGPPLPPGALAYVMCQRSGSAIGTSTVWNRLVDSRWVPDYHVANRSNTTWSAPVPRCP
ncbi:glycoside hydrolase domain-containing protein [Tenggerimyces flavus]|uniref:Glycoside hydrolase domain-containing protein n=1 Tax=Tenggerimyces flavus TaxID=1708749 RepID=A0ABV7YN03_9ACTN|nr:glycoside hydrolase domain-containing protein [Tenggerimyces flavus]MBM7790197.1 hypothetical protein [Tenggerimyces flavus]